MTAIAMAESVSAVFLVMESLRLASEREKTKSNRYLLVCMLMCVFTLLVDAMAYTFVGPKYPVAFRYIINLLAFEAGAINSICFALYVKSFVTQRKKLNPWVFRCLIITDIAWIIAIASEFVSGRFITYSYGIENVSYAIPLYMQLLMIAITVYMAIIVLSSSREIGRDVSFMFCVFIFAPIISVVIANFTAFDFTYIFSAFAITLIAEFIQKKIIQNNARQQKALSDGLAREYHTVWLMDGFGDHNMHLYRSTGKATVQSAVQLGLAEPCFDTSVVKYIRDNVLEEDQERVIEETRFETIERETPETGTYVVTYRRYTADRSDYTYHQMCFARALADDETVNYILAYRDADNMMKDQIAQQKQLEEALASARLEERRNRLTLEIAGASSWSYGISADDRVISADYSTRAKNMVDNELNHDPMEWIDLIHPEDREQTLEKFMAAVRDHSGRTPYEVTYRVLTAGGEYRWVKTSGRVLRHDDGTAELFGMSVDITEQIEKERLQQEQLEKALDMAEEASKAKTDFLFNMSHDIRTPMNAIIGFTNIAKKEINNREKALDSLGKVQLSSEILLNLINDVLDMSRIESGKVELHEEKYEITEAFDSFEAAMSSLAASKDIDLKFSIGKVRDRYIFADGPRFDRVMINIISNAIKYTPAEGFVKVTAEQTEDSMPGYGNYRFTVTDSGIGMSEEFQKHMFEDFSREDNSTTRSVQGTGLGLALAKNLVDLMGGSISCESTQGIGTTFTIIFPFRLQTEEDKAEEKAVVKEYAEISLSGKRVLLVEDNELNREIAEEILSGEGITVETATDGLKAVNKVREKGAAYYDFILMDIQMPVMDGYEAAKTIRRLMPDIKAPIIALSANAFAEDKKKSVEAGMDDHVAKPINIRELISVLAKFL